MSQPPVQPCTKQVDKQEVGHAAPKWSRACNAKAHTGEELQMQSQLLLSSVHTIIWCFAEI